MEKLILTFIFALPLFALLKFLIKLNNYDINKQERDERTIV